MNAFLKEINPLHDFDKLYAESTSKTLEGSIEESFEIITDRMYVMLKPLLRGGILGAGVGTAIGAFTDDPRLYAAYGTMIGISLDYAQTSLRFAAYTIDLLVKEFKKKK